METKPWEHQPGETDRDYAAFRQFLAGFPKQRVAEADGRSRPRIVAISKRWNWDKRLQEFRKQPPAAVAAVAELLPPQDTATILIDSAMSDAQVSHLQKISDYQARAERLGNAQISIAGQLLMIAQKRIAEHRTGSRRQMAVEPLIRAATMAATSGHKLVGDALGIEELFLTMQQHLTAIDPAKVEVDHAT